MSQNLLLRTDISVEQSLSDYHKNDIKECNGEGYLTLLFTRNLTLLFTRNPMIIKYKIMDRKTSRKYESSYGAKCNLPYGLHMK